MQEVRAYPLVGLSIKTADNSVITIPNRGLSIVKPRLMLQRYLQYMLVVKLFNLMQLKF